MRNPRKPRKVRKAIRTHPGPARAIGRNRSYLDYILYFLMLVAVLSLVLTFVQSNRHLFHLEPPRQYRVFSINILDIKWLDYTTSVGLLAGLFTIFFARYQFSLSQRPLISYYSRKKDRTETAFNIKKGAIFNTTSIKNEGAGLAIVLSSGYKIALSERELDKPYVSYWEVEEKLREMGFLRERDYWLTYFSPGWTIGADATERIFEMNTALITSIFAIDIRITYAGLLGDKYEKQIYCIPRPFKRL